MRILLPLALVAALVVAGCGSSDSSDSKSSSGTVDVASASMGKILVGPNGRTLYLFEKDKGPKSECTGDCLAEWPPLTVSGKPTAGSGVTGSKLGTSKLSDGKTIVTYNGHPLYYYAADTKAGETTGQGLDRYGAEWYVLSPAGNKVEGGEDDEGGSSGGSTPSPY
jgi:predicted lipoprotein with Yx(FWY)xxD motif